MMLPMISNCRPHGPTNLHITSSTVAVCTWNRSWSLGNVDSSTLISCFNTFRQAIIGRRASTPRRCARIVGSVLTACGTRPLIGKRRHCRTVGLGPCPSGSLVVATPHATTAQLMVVP